MVVASVNVGVSSLEAKWAKGLEQKKDRALSYSLVMRPQAQVLNCETGGLSLRVSSGSCQPPYPTSYDYSNIPAPLLRKALSLLALVQSQGIHYCGSNNTRSTRNLSCIDKASVGPTQLRWSPLNPPDTGAWGLVAKVSPSQFPIISLPLQPHHRYYAQHHEERHCQLCGDGDL